MPKVEKYTEAARVKRTDFIVGMDKDGNVLKYSGLFFLRTVESETNFLSLIQDEEEERIFNDGLLDAKITTLGNQMGLNLSNIQLDLDSFKVSIHNDIFGTGGLQDSLLSFITQTDTDIRIEIDRLLYGAGGITESYTSAITQSATQINLSVDTKLYGVGGIEASYTSMINATAAQIELSVDEKLYGVGGIEESYSSLIQQTSQSIILAVEQELYGPGGIQQQYSSAIQQYSDQIILTVSGTLYNFETEVYTEVNSLIAQLADSIDLSVFTDGVLDAGVLIGRINNNTTGVRIIGSQILLDGDVEITGTTFAQNVYASGATIGGATINATSLQFGNQATWSPAVGTGGVLMGQDVGDSLYKFFIGKQDAYLLWNGTQLSITGDVVTDAAFADNVYLSGATIGGFNITENYLNLGTQTGWTPNLLTTGLIMGKDVVDNKYKFFIGDAQYNLIWDGASLIISGSTLIGGGGGTTTIGDLGKLDNFFEIINEGQAGEYLKVLSPLAVVGDIQAWSADPNIFPPSIWASLPIASDTVLGAVRIGAGLVYDPITGVISVDGGVGTGFDESANYSPSGTWGFTGAVSIGGSPVATQAYAQPVITGGASTITSSNLTASRALVSNTLGKVAVSAVTSTELGYLDGVTSAIQAQLNGKASLNGSSVQNFTVKDLIIHGTVNHWLADTITIEDARLQLNKKAGAASVASGLDIFDGINIVSSLDYGTDSIWRAGGQRIYTDTYKPLSDNSTQLGGVVASDWVRRTVAQTITAIHSYSTGININNSTLGSTHLGTVGGDNYITHLSGKSTIFRAYNGTTHLTSNVIINDAGITAVGNAQVREAVQLANSSGTVIWTLQRNAGSDLEFRNQAGVYVGKLTQAGNFEVIGEITAFS